MHFIYKNYIMARQTEFINHFQLCWKHLTNDYFAFYNLEIGTNTTKIS